MTISEKIFTLMKEKNKKAADLCKILDISTAQTTAWKKRNTDPPAKYITKICEFLEISIYELLGAEEEQLTDEEQLLLKHFRKCSNGNRQIILNAASGLSNQKLELKEPEQETKSSTLKIG